MPTHPPLGRKQPLHNLAIENLPPETLRPYASNARVHSKRQIRQIADSIERFGFTNPVLIGDDREIIAGAGRHAAALLLGLSEVPTAQLSHLSPAERRAYILADNKLALNAGWDQEILAIELQGLVDLDFDLTLTGFSLAEIDFTLDAAKESDPKGRPAKADLIQFIDGTATTQLGDVWVLGRHKLICGDARDEEVYAALMGDERADIVFTDPPYNVAIDGNVCGGGRIRHREFAMGVGEFTPDEFTEFLTTTLSCAAERCRNGAIVFVCMDWRHMGELLAAGQAVFDELKNVCVWNKTNGGQGQFYRSKHEMIFVFKVGDAPHVNSFGLGETGRYRTNVWDYPGVSSVGAARDAALAMHPTVKPTALVADALRDCSKRGDIVLDGFAGSGTVMAAAQITGRTARLIELDPLYCDTIVRRYENITGKRGVLQANGQTFEDVAWERGGGSPVTEAAE